MYKSLKIMGYLPYQLVSRISSINSSEVGPSSIKPWQVGEFIEFCVSGRGSAKKFTSGFCPQIHPCRKRSPCQNHLQNVVFFVKGLLGRKGKIQALPLFTSIFFVDGIV